MDPLAKPMRKQLEDAVVKARDIAEDAARAALLHLGVGEASVPKHLTDDERALRRRLRAHGRQLGDQRGPDGQQAIEQLAQETAYEHWHRMLFARFLAENQLLMHPEGVALSLAECQELARDEGAANGWELAGRYAARMLPQIFRPDSPVLALDLAPEHQRALERLLANLAPETFHANDGLGWVYQFWQTKQKDRVNASEVKIGARELPAVTQLFTEPYMVTFLLDNSLGAWWAARRLSDEDRRTATSEEALRHKAAIPGVPLTYLRFVQDEQGVWTPAAGTFDAWPTPLSELTVMDPCCGSGHFLVAVLQMLVRMRMALEGLDARAAIDAVLRENLHGLELDQRCVEIAAFALALTAWRWPDAGGYRPLPALNLACSGLGIHASKADWLQLAEGDVDLQHALERIYELFQDAPTLGSLIDPRRAFRDDDLIDLGPQRGWERVAPLVERALASEDEQQRELGVVAAGLARAAQLLADRYQCVITNVPYLARGKQQERLRDFCERHHSEAKNDLATVFLERCLGLCVEGGTSSVVLPQNWLFLTSYRKLREKLLKQERWHLIARLGPGAFETISGEVVKGILLTLSRGNPATAVGGFLDDSEADAGHLIRGVDVSEYRTAAEKAKRLLAAEIKTVGQAEQLDNPDARVGFIAQTLGNYISEIADCYQGLVTGDIERFTRKFWEVSTKNDDWLPFRRSNNTQQFYGDVSEVILWEDGLGQLHRYAITAREQLHDMHESGNRVWGKAGIAINRMRDLKAVPFWGEHFDNNVAVACPSSHDELAPLLAFFASDEFPRSIRDLDQTLKVTNKTLLKVPFDLGHWQQVAAERYPNGIPKPYSDDPTQWIFHGHPCASVIWNEQTKWTAIGPKRTDASVLQVAVARLLGYRWSVETKTESDPEMELSDESRQLLAEARQLDSLSDDDGILCLPALRGEPAAHERLLNLLIAAYGEDWTTGTLSTLLQAAGAAGKPLEVWLRDYFFEQHCKLFQHRPFIWHIWDGLKDGFAALVNYHQLDRAKLERLIYTYLDDWIRLQQRAGAGGGADAGAGTGADTGTDHGANAHGGADERLAAARALKTKLEAILDGEAPLDIFVRWKPLAEQPIGWNPDLNDGVRLNIRPFLLAGDVGNKGAGLLRAKPNIKWTKDRGKDVESAPWFPVFNGERINDHHLTLAEKRAARHASERSGSA